MRTYEHAADELNALLRERGISGAELSRLLEIDGGIMRSILAGRKKNISTRNMLMMARFFEIEMQELMDRFS